LYKSSTVPVVPPFGPSRRSNRNSTGNYNVNVRVYSATLSLNQNPHSPLKMDKNRLSHHTHVDKYTYLDVSRASPEQPAHAEVVESDLLKAYRTWQGLSTYFA
ncbi:hypothetical protein SARC_10875, partial [Sphaeroforma arctica JP610]